MREAIYISESAARDAARYIRGPQVKEVRVVRLNFECYQPTIVWDDDSVSGMEMWQPEWFSLNKEI